MNNSVTPKSDASTTINNITTFYNNKCTSNLGNLIIKALAGYSIRDSIPSLLDIEQLTGDNKWGSILQSKVPFTGTTYFEGPPEFKSLKYYIKNENNEYIILENEPADWGDYPIYVKNNYEEYEKIIFNTDNGMGKLQFTSIVSSKDKTLPQSNSTCRICMYNNKNELLAYTIDIESEDQTGKLDEEEIKNVKDVYNNIDPGTEAIVRWQLTFYNYADLETTESESSVEQNTEEITEIIEE